ncbi:phytoene desaturase [Filimonas lacunae]|uniref:Phytoene desaturase n=1 Tax=Filimonas lacunae TaxID=477680 RepID=A0A173MJ26_9BACT|nr:phytoene desaturase family protein [Filimonas lacunae]BAV07477.1 phytoene dehydrogenase [Filimonas lacunae]SIT30231.1 phytoene desaturase [Filimonas lacunae]
MRKKIAVIGSGFSGIAAAAYAAQAGNEVHVFEKNSTLGGRARQFTTDNGYTFDMGPSWYWMPDIIENFFTDFNTSAASYYQLVALNPQFEMVFDGEAMAIPERYEDLQLLFESIEPGAALQLDRFMKEAQYKYEVGMRDFVNKPCHSWFEFVSLKIARSALKLDLLTSFRKHVRRFFSEPKLIALMEFPVLFLGAMPEDIPALYSLMNYGGLKLGTWYPLGGFIKIIDAMAAIARQQGVTFHVNATVEKVNVQNNRAVSVTVNSREIPFDAIIASSDYHHTEQQLLEKPYRNYDEAYWEKKTFAPSCLIYYVGVKERVPGLTHHTLFFENDLQLHANEIYKDKKWPTQPLFYVCCPSKTDKMVAPANHENLFLLMPIATGIEDREAIREKYFLQMLQRIEKHTGARDLLQKIDYKKSYCIYDFTHDYNAYKGNAYGLANTLRQTAVLKPAIRNKKIKNLYYTGQLTVPGPGVPPSLISGKIAATAINKLKI